MSQKRKHTEALDSSSSVSKPPKRHRTFKPGANQSQAKHKKRPHVSTDIDKSTSTNALKSRIRDLKRLLAHVDHVGDHKMSASNRIERERELEACEHELAEKVESSREAEYKKKLIGKYHQVRFFDRQRASRILKRLKKELSNIEDETKRTSLEEKIHNTEVDINYAIYYPLMKPYSSLYPKSKNDKVLETEGDDEGPKETGSELKDGPKGDVEMWRTVEKAMQEGTLDALRYNKDSMPAAPVKKKDKKLAKNTPIKAVYKGPEPANRRERRALEAQAEEDSDGGFFE